MQRDPSGADPAAERSGLRAVADVNVLASAARTPNGVCARLLEAAAEGRWRPILCPTLFEELVEVLARPAFHDVLGQDAINRFLAALAAIGEWTADPTAPPPVASRDPDDDYLLALAAETRADALISGDRDLTSLAGLTPAIETPAQFERRIA